MGKGKTKNPAEARREAVADAGAAGGRAKREPSPCERAVVVDVALRPGSAIQRGDEVTIAAGRPPTVRTKNKATIGSVAAADAPELEGCIALGFRFTGTVETVDSETATAAVRVSGTRGADS